MSYRFVLPVYRLSLDALTAAVLHVFLGLAFSRFIQALRRPSCIGNRRLTFIGSKLKPRLAITCLYRGCGLSSGLRSYLCRRTRVETVTRYCVSPGLPHWILDQTNGICDLVA